MTEETVQYFDFKEDKKAEPNMLIFRKLHYINILLHSYTFSSSIEIPQEKWDAVTKAIINIITTH